MTTYPIQATFNRGELSPRLHSRVDIAHFRQGLAECTNWMTMVYGGIRKSPGFRFVNEVKDSSKRTRIIPFVFSTEQAYGLEFGDGYVRVYANQGIVRDAGSEVEIATPYSDDEVFELHYTQSADVLYLAHRNHAPRKIERSSSTAWTISEIAFEDGPYLPEHDTDTTLNPDSSSGTIEFVASSTAGINEGAGFQTDDVGRSLRFFDGNKWNWLVITARTSNRIVTAQLRSDSNLSSTSEKKRWRLGAWSATTGYPARVGFFQERLCWARTDLQPQTIWPSQAGNLESHAVSDPLLDDDAMTLTILAGQVNAIQWIAEGDDLKIGTTGAARTLGAQTNADAFSPTNVQQRRQASFGASDRQPIDVGNVTLYSGFHRKTVREFLYSYEVDGYAAPKITTLSEHLTKAGISEMAFAQEPESIVWMVCDCGRLVGMTYERDQEVVGMFPRLPSGADAAFESVMAIPGLKADEVWVVVRRTVDGATRRYVEMLDLSIDEDTDLEDAFYVDSGLTYTGPATSTVSGLEHLEGETVTVFADGAVLKPDQTVAGGSVTLPGGVTASKIHVGLPYTATARTLPAVVSGRDGATLGRRQRVVKAFLDILKSASVKAGTKSEQFDLTNQSGSGSTGLHTGWFPVRFANSWEGDASIVIVSEDPLPALVRSVILGVEGEP